MRTIAKALIISGSVLTLGILTQTTAARKVGPEYLADGQLRLPSDYREWVYLSTGFNMSYNPTAAMMDHDMFDNVFVNPEAWRAFKASGRWPDKTVFVLEARRAQNKGSINQKGSFQDSDVMAVEVHVKDRARFQGDWAFFEFPGGSATGKMVPTTEDCYSCHRDHGAVETTFVQFYPTALPIAKSKGTLTGENK